VVDLALVEIQALWLACQGDGSREPGDEGTGILMMAGCLYGPIVMGGSRPGIGCQGILRQVDKDLARVVGSDILKPVAAGGSNRVNGRRSRNTLQADGIQENILAPVILQGTRTADMKNSGDDLGMEIRRLRNEKQAIQAEEASQQDRRTRIDEMMTFLNDLPRELTEYDEQYVRTLIDKITVNDDHFIVEFKSGIEIQIDQ
jgi:hypothetical protein